MADMRTRNGEVVFDEKKIGWLLTAFVSEEMIYAWGLTENQGKRMGRKSRKTSKLSRSTMT
jgi:hypothetical protein